MYYILGPSTKLKGARVFRTTDSATQRGSLATTILSVLRHSVILPSTPNSEVKIVRYISTGNYSGPLSVVVSYGDYGTSLSLVVIGGAFWLPITH